jgi:flagellar protein FliO/FliZ
MGNVMDSEGTIIRGRAGVIAAVIIFSLSMVLCPIAYAKKGKPSRGKAITEKVKDKKGEKVTEETASRIEREDNESVKKVSEERDAKDKDAKDKDATEGDLYSYEKPVIEEESYVWLIIKTIIVLGSLIGGFYYFFRFVTKKAGIQVLGRDVVQVLSIVPLGQNKFLQVVDLAGRVLVLGISDSGIHLITEVKEKEEIDRIRLLSSKSSPVQPGGFQEYVSKQIGRLLKGRNIEQEPGSFSRERKVDRMDFLKMQRDRLRGISKMNSD